MCSLTVTPSLVVSPQHSCTPYLPVPHSPAILPTQYSSEPGYTLDMPAPQRLTLPPDTAVNYSMAALGAHHRAACSQLQDPTGSLSVSLHSYAQDTFINKHAHTHVNTQIYTDMVSYIDTHTETPTCMCKNSAICIYIQSYNLERLKGSGTVQENPNHCQ